MIYSEAPQGEPVADHLTDPQKAAAWAAVHQARQERGWQPKERTVTHNPPRHTHYDPAAGAAGPKPPPLTPADKRIQARGNQLGREPWAKLAARTVAAARRNRTASAQPDGLPAGSDEAPVTTSGTSDPTYQAATARQQADHLDRNVTRALDAWKAIGHAVGELHRALNAIDDQTNTADLNPPPGCEILARVGQWEDIHRRTEIDGRTWALSKWAYDFHRRVGRLPSKAEAEAHAQGRRVRLPA